MTTVTSTTVTQHVIPIHLNGDVGCLTVTVTNVHAECIGSRWRPWPFGTRTWVNTGDFWEARIYPCTKAAVVVKRPLIVAAITPIPCLEDAKAWAYMVDQAFGQVSPQAILDP